MNGGNVREEWESSGGSRARRTFQERGVESHGAMSLKRAGTMIRSPGPEQ